MASIERARSGDVTTADVARTGTRGTADAPSALAGLALLLDLLAQPRFLRAQLGRELGAEVLGLEHGPDLQRRLRAGRVRAAFRPLDRLLQRLHLPDPEAGDELLGLGERPVHDR